MANITVKPERFTMVEFDSARIAGIANEVADKVGLPADLDVTVDVDESVPLGRTRIVSLDPVVVNVQGGAFENNKNLRQLSDRNVVDVLGRVFHRVADRLDPRFADAPADDELSLQEATAWDAYAVGRCDQLGFQPQKQRRLYHFRNRHGFNDVADAVFERLWTSPPGSLGWADIEAACAETAAVRESAA